jgi:hypothetical protein
MIEQVWILRYGFDYEYDTIFGAYTSYYKANEAKEELIEITGNEYDYYTVSCFNLDEKVVVNG